VGTFGGYIIIEFPDCGVGIAIYPMLEGVFIARDFCPKSMSWANLRPSMWWLPVSMKGMPKGSIQAPFSVSAKPQEPRQ